MGSQIRSLAAVVSAGIVVATFGIVSAGCGRDGVTTPTPPPTPPPQPTLAVSLNPSSSTSGQPVQGTVTLMPAPTTAATVSLSSSNSSVASVPASVTVSAGSTTGTFTVTTSAVTSATTVTVTASYAGSASPVSATATLSVSPPTPQSLVLVDMAGRLASGFNIFVNTNRGLTTWLTQAPDGLQAAYPPGQAFGFIAVVLSGPTDLGNRPGRDMSSYRTLQIQLRGATGAERIEVGIKDNTDPDTGMETKKMVPLSANWQTYSFPLADFVTADLRRLYLFTELVFDGPVGQIVYVRDVQFIP